MFIVAWKNGGLRLTKKVTVNRVDKSEDLGNVSMFVLVAIGQL